ncbi:MAG: CDP-alcohol phosphatidyltransferase family protein [Chloroflexota bacterium]|nr:CDP-alcohol phosphatidyltransferase family protein [Chloroflexota bacterium]
MSKIKSHQRVNDILLGPLERPALAWLAAHQPAWMTPDILTIIGIFGSVLIFVSYALSRINPAFLWLASLGFVINWYGDSLDGTLARHRKIERPKYGFFVDHIVDAISEVMVFLGLGLTYYVRFDIAAIALVGYLLMSVYVYVTTAVTGVFQISYGKFGPTEVRVLAILANTAMFFFGTAVILREPIDISIYDVFVAIVAVALYGIFIGKSLQQAKILDKEDRARAAAKTE